MNIEALDHLSLLTGLVGAVGVLVSGYWALTKTAIAAFNRSLDERFAAMEKARADGQSQWTERMQKNEAKLDELERDVRKILVELPREYVTRSDYVRRETVIEGKIDQLALRIQNWILEGKNA